MESRSFVASLISLCNCLKFASGCASYGWTDVRQVPLRYILGGSAIIESEIKPIGDGMIRSATELRCYDWSNYCRWRNEIGSENRPGIDQLDWARATGTPDPIRLGSIFGTPQLPGGIDNKYAVTGSWRLHNTQDSALLVSDPVPCQLNEGRLSFQYWTSPLTRINVCVRRPNAGKNFVFCSPPVTTGSPGPAIAVIPGPINFPFEIVISASGFTFVRGFIRGGLVIIDTLDYQAIPCNSALDNDVPPSTCHSVSCSFASAGSADYSQPRPGMCYYQAAVDARSLMKNVLNGLPVKIYTTPVQNAGRKWVCDSGQAPPIRSDTDTCWTLKFPDILGDINKSPALYCC